MKMAGKAVGWVEVGSCTFTGIRSRCKVDYVGVRDLAQLGPDMH